MIKKSIVFPDGTTGEYHVVHSFVFGDDGGCVAKVSSYSDMFEACTMRNRVHVMPLRCDGVSPTESTLAQIYGVMANDPLFSGAEPLSSEAETGLANPFAVRAAKPDQPSKWHTWDAQAWVWIIPDGTLDKAKAEAKTRINLSRDEAERGGFEAYGKVFDSDDKSINRILSAAQAASAAKAASLPMSVEWTCADNTTLIMDADMLIEIPVILAQTADALHQKARILKARIDAATTLEEIASIVW